MGGGERMETYGFGRVHDSNSNIQHFYLLSAPSRELDYSVFVVSFIKSVAFTRLT